MAGRRHHVRQVGVRIGDPVDVEQLRAWDVGGAKPVRLFPDT
jgi:hypothetical protein